MKRICSLFDRSSVCLLHILWLRYFVWHKKAYSQRQHNSYLFLDGFRCNMGRLLHTIQSEWRNCRLCVWQSEKRLRRRRKHVREGENNVNEKATITGACLSYWPTCYLARISTSWLSQSRKQSSLLLSIQLSGHCLAPSHTNNNARLVSVRSSWEKKWRV